MLGLREKRAWITRLGVIRSNRRRGTGTALVGHLLAQAKQHDVNHVILEVIKNNVPAHNLFLKFGFTETRELLVLRRPPGRPKNEAPPAEIENLGYKQAIACLERRKSTPSWLDERASLLNAGNLEGFQAFLPDGSCGWLVFQNTVFQLARLVLQTETGNPQAVGRALLHHLHTVHSAQDTKTENLPAEDPHWPMFKELGYIQMFQRIEMILELQT
jgi:hypothetical protein